MCGIIGYLGLRTAVPILLTGLRRLEYRGYDSAGVALAREGVIEIHRAVGRVSQLEELLGEDFPHATLGIAHTRWATHGRPSEANAHPHRDASGRIALVHNGIVENHAALRKALEAEGIVFRSETDTEALAQLVGYYRERGANDLRSAVVRALRDVTGTFGIAVISADEPDTLVVARRGSPLLVGVGDGEWIVASDGSAIVEHTSQVIYLHDNEVVTLRPDGLRATNLDDAPVVKEQSTLELSLEEIELGGFQHYMAKEIHEQPRSLRAALAGRMDAAEGRARLGGLAPMERDLGRLRRLQLFGCGTAWHACLVGEYLFEELARLPTEVEYASELRYRNPIVEEGTMAIAVSQSGETADTLAALREMKLKGAMPFGVVNAVGSSIAREADAGIYLHVGPEIGVASTKAFTGQVAVMALLAIDFGRRRHLSPERTSQYLRGLEAIPDQLERVLLLEDEVRRVTERYIDRHNWLYLGRGVNYPVALEGALKLKEISYLHAEGMPAAEIKHGPLALIEPGMPVVVIAPRDHTYDKVLSNIEEVRGRGGRIIAVASEGDDEIGRIADEVLRVPETLPLLSPLLTVVPLQLMAYHAALLRGMNVDKPRNLAKSVTVE